VPNFPRDARMELEAIYRDVDAATRSLGVGCWARGDCCDFDRCDHVLYASSVELAYVREKHPEAFPAHDALCPFWKEGKCTERERRPLGCRTYFCDRRYRNELEALHESHYRRIRDLAARLGLAWAYAPFVASLRDASGRQAP
jgi:Fe-S-cluster containining protein